MDQNMKRPLPLVSVILPNFNGGQFLRKAVRSILGQTYRHFELIYIDDGSTDNSMAIMRTIKDPRVRMIINRENRGLVYCLNLGIQSAQGKYIARMDADDISLPHRLKCQIQFMEKHSSISICGAWIKTIGRKHTCWRNDRLPISDVSIKLRLFFGNSLVHPTVMMRKAFIDARSLSYNPDMKKIEDYDLWSRVGNAAQFANIPKTLLKYRYHDLNLSHIDFHFDTSRKSLLYSIYKRLFDSNGIQYDDNDLDLHYRLNDYPKIEGITIDQIVNWLLRLRNSFYAQYDLKSVDKVLLYQWYFICRSFFSKKMNLPFLFINSPFFKLTVQSIKYVLVLHAKYLLLKLAIWLK
jgi:glycosyltransferase involved in cell wall biosynthesis